MEITTRTPEITVNPMLNSLRPCISSEMSLPSLTDIFLKLSDGLINRIEIPMVPRKASNRKKISNVKGALRTVKIISATPKSPITNKAELKIMIWLPKIHIFSASSSLNSYGITAERVALVQKNNCCNWN